MIKFQVKDYALVLDETTLMVAEFKALVTYDKSKFKDNGLADLLYVYMFCDEDSPFATTDLADRDRAVRYNVYRDADYVWEPVRRRLVEAAIATYRYLNDTVEGRTMASLDKRIEAVQRFLDEDINIDSLQAVKDQVDLATNVANLIEKKAKLRDTIAKAGKTKVRNKADAASSPLEGGRLDYGRISESRRSRQDGKAAPSFSFASEPEPAPAIVPALPPAAAPLDSFEQFQALDAAGEVPSLEAMLEMFKGQTPAEQAATLARLKQRLPDALETLHQHGRLSAEGVARGRELVASTDTDDNF